MSSLLTTIDHSTDSNPSKTILSKNGYTGVLTVLAPDEEMSLPEAEQAGDEIIFMVDGHATLRSGDLNTLLNQDQAVLLPKGREHVLVSHSEGYAKVLRMTIPPREVVTPQIITLSS